MLGAFAVAAALSLKFARLNIDPAQFAVIAAWLAAAMGLSRMRGRIGGVGFARSLDFLETGAIFCGIISVGAVANYSVAALSAGYIDQWLASIDRTLDFDWEQAYRLTFAHPAIERFSRITYSSIFLSPIVIIAALCAAGKVDRVRLFLCVYALALGATIFALCWCATAGPLSLSTIGDDGHSTAVGVRYVAVIDGLRAGTIRSIDLTRMEGLVSMPSFHAASGMMFSWAVWPLRRFRWPILAINLAMIVATPVEGNHYLIDVIAGLGLAAAAIWLVDAALARRSAGIAQWTIVPPPGLLGNAERG